MIRPGLSRISRLVTPSTFPWKAIHVAGTNGKGSVCAYLDAMLTAGGVRCGKFTSPHLIDRWDCITIGSKVVHQDLFREIEEFVHRKNSQQSIEATEFELLTATAFEIFNHENVDVGIVEVGMGGREDTTNVLEHKLATVITKIGYDHQAFLGRTIQEIAFQKAGIMKPGVDCVIDGSNSDEVKKVLGDQARHVTAIPWVTDSNTAFEVVKSHERYLFNGLEPHQLSNLGCATKALEICMSHLRPDLDTSTLITAALTAQWPGRLEFVSIEALAPRTTPVLLDGAHNAQSAAVLNDYVDRHIRGSTDLHKGIQGEPVTWVLAASKGKHLESLFKDLIRVHDKVIPVKFGPVDGMPWVEAEDPSKIVAALSDKKGLQLFNEAPNLLETLRLATKISAGGPLVIAGSLYLVSDVHRLLRSTASP
jgi:dihydrofolate synthase